MAAVPRFPSDLSEDPMKKKKPKKPYLATALLAALILPSCGVLTPQQRSNVRTTVEQEYIAGNITQAQRDAAIEALDNDKPFDWTTLGVIGTNILLSLVGAPMIVRLQRGQPTQVVGLPASKVRPTA